MARVVQLQETSPINPQLSLNSCSWWRRRQWINQRSHYCQITDMGSEINVSCLTPADSSESDSFCSTLVIGRRPKLRVLSSGCASTCMARIFIYLCIYFALFCFSLLASNRLKSQQKKTYSHWWFHHYLIFKSFYALHDLWVNWCAGPPKTWQFMEIQNLEAEQQQPHYHLLIWAHSPKRCYQPRYGSCGEKQDQSNPFSGFCVYHDFKLRLRPWVVMETAAAGGEGKKRLDCWWT